MKLFLLIQIFVGFILFVQISDHLLEKCFVSLKTILCFVFFCFIAFSLVFYFFRFSTFLFCFCCYAPYFVLFSLKYFLKYVRKREFREEFFIFLNEIILHMRSGKSFRTGVEISKSKRKKTFQRRIHQMMEAVIFSQDLVFYPDLSFIKQIFYEFKKVDLHSHNALKRLIYFRDKLQFENRFERKSQKILAHVRLQSFFLFILYVLLLGFTFYKYGFRSNMPMILISLGLFFSGFFIFIQIGRNLKWKV